MAMDKEKLLTYFQDHYLSRREVLFKLPLSMSIDTFWPELLNRRKAKAMMLPLYGASGIPYWYVLTEKMIAASEKLCEEAMNQDENFDPYRARMTSAMTEEMFFTSFVEGAQIPLNEAMDFLQRGTEPENVQEQMIWNNRQAWSAMANALYKPLDEPFVKSLAFMLTDEMVGRADDYRQTDKHVVAAMNEEAYELPPASCIADRMRGYYDLLRSPDMHPLIKAAIGQAYLLTIRPFPEGNERLSRMISSAVLLRSGYGYFRDISISSHIARENYRYYQAMCDVLRSENGNDLTYFMEYYLDLLARALDAKKDRDKRRDFDRDREAMDRERELSLQPLGGEVNGGASETASVMAKDDAMAPLLSKCDSAAPLLAKDDSTAPLLTKDISAADITNETELRHGTQTSFFPQENVARIGFTSQSSDVQVNCDAIHDVLNSSQNPLLNAHVDISNASNGFQDSINRPQNDTFYDEQALQKYYMLLERIATRKTERTKRVTSMLRYFIGQGITRFSRLEWQEIVKVEQKLAQDDCQYMVSNGLAVSDRNYKKPIYTLTLITSETNEQNDSPDQYALIRETLNNLCETGTNREKRIAATIKEMLDDGLTEFTQPDWARLYGHGRTMNNNDLRCAVNYGLVEYTDDGLRICERVTEETRYGNLNYKVSETLDVLLLNFKDHPFSMGDAAVIFKIKTTSIAYRLAQLQEKGILSVTKRGKDIYKYSFTEDFIKTREGMNYSDNTNNITAA